MPHATADILHFSTRPHCKSKVHDVLVFFELLMFLYVILLANAHFVKAQALSFLLLPSFRPALYSRARRMQRDNVKSGKRRQSDPGCPERNAYEDRATRNLARTATGRSG